MNALGLIAGNSRYHWGWLQNGQLKRTWHTPWHSPTTTWVQNHCAWPLVVVSPVPAQVQLWQKHNQAKVITLSDIPLPGIYATLGIDRALAAWGASQLYGSPVLVIDAGTAISLNAVDERGQFMGGAILPGLALQCQSLHRGTGALPAVTWPLELPALWANDTIEAIQSGIGYTVVAGLNFYLKQWAGKVVITGGDGAWLGRQLRGDRPDLLWQPDLLLRCLALWGQIPRGASRLG
ncbi:pantothenate kinase [Gloeomargarita lithophora Alchichica-D10]|uniref:Type III pantothenate kinase n=1 Tax=Gloeomargarita lithophora Alchichica-D10 TaxID=1188229 RepID=A0A1J0A8X5_9CYAN|nr:type III pantothenate kinase [Gloeomargarita lithophora]APB32361.1 pantothenate kinase [Gloeomargarita lithophora Alchichica-D10]